MENRTGTTGHLDYLSCTFFRTDIQEHLEETFGEFDSEVVPHNGYRRGQKSSRGAILYSEGSADMGIHLVLSGQVLQNVRDTVIDGWSIQDHEICQLIRTKGGTASRIDCALNIYNVPGFSMATVWRAYRQGKIHAKAKSRPRRYCEVATDEEKNSTEALNALGDTMYWGSTQSERMLRAYNKAAEQNVADKMAWVRLEMQCKKLRADAILKACADNANTRHVVNSVIRDFIEWNNPVFVQSTKAGNVDIDPVGRKLTDTLRWMKEQVAPAMANYQIENPDVDVLALMAAWFEDSYKSKVKAHAVT